MEDTIIKVGITREDDYGNMWVTPEGGGKEVKIGEKRKNLFPLFQQGNTVSLHWETYKNKPYVSDAKQIVGEPVLPKPQPAQRESFDREAAIAESVAFKGFMDNLDSPALPNIAKQAAICWGLRKLGISEVPVETPQDAPQATTEPSGKESSTPAPTGDKSRFKDGQALVNLANKKMSLEKIKKESALEAPGAFQEFLKKTDPVDLEAAAKVLGI